MGSENCGIILTVYWSRLRSYSEDIKSLSVVSNLFSLIYYDNISYESRETVMFFVWIYFLIIISIILIYGKNPIRGQLLIFI